MLITSKKRTTFEKVARHKYVWRAGAHLPCSKAKASQQIRAVVGRFCCKVETLHRLFGTFLYYTSNTTRLQWFHCLTNTQQGILNRFEATKKRPFCLFK